MKTRDERRAYHREYMIGWRLRHPERTAGGQRHRQLAGSSSAVDRAWATGFYDGEGCAHAKFSDLGGTPTLQIGQTNREPLEKCKAAFWGLGNILGPYSVGIGSKSKKAFWTYAVNGYQSVQTVMSAMWPFLSTEKRDQYKLVMAKCASSRYENEAGPACMAACPAPPVTRVAPIA